MTSPIDLHRRRYNNEAFLGKNYTTVFPDFLRDANRTIKGYSTGVCSSTIPLLPSIKQVSLNCSRNRIWLPGTVLIFQARSNSQQFALRVKSYNKDTGQLIGLIINVSTVSRFASGDASVRSDTYWYVYPPEVGSLDFSRTNGTVLGLAAGGLGFSMVNRSLPVKDSLGMDLIGFRTLKLEDDFMGGEAYDPITEEPADPVWYKGGIYTPDWTSGVTANEWGLARAEGNSSMYPASDPDVGFEANRANRLKIDNSAGTDFKAELRLMLGTIPGGSTMLVRFGYTTGSSAWLAADSSVYLEYDSASSANWKLKSSNGTLYSTTGAVAAVFNAWTVLTIEKTGATITYRVNGTSIGTKNSNYPIGLMHPRYQLSSTGAGPVFNLLDFIRIKHAC